MGCARTGFELGPGPGSGDAGPDSGADLSTDGAPLDGTPLDGGLDAGFDLGMDIGPPDFGVPCGGDDCSALDDVCVVGECDPAADVCVAVPRPDGTSCDDGQTCTMGDACRRGVCTGRGPDCSDLDSACTVGVCSDATGSCIARPVPNGTGCEDGDLCTTGDTCRRGSCVAGPPLDCTDLADGCNIGVCNPMLGACEAVPVPDDTACEDGLACTVDDFCVAGVCSAGADLDCTGFSDTCLLGTCDEAAGGCVTVDERDGTLCDDGDECTTDDVCGMGACLPGLPVIAAGDTCAAATALASRDGFQLAAQATVCASNTQEGTCGGAGGDVFYSLELTAPRRVRLETVTVAGSYDTTLHVREDCADPATEVACDDDGGMGSLSLLERVYQPGDYTFVIDGSGPGDEGFFNLEVDVEVPNTCATAVPLGLPAEGDVLTISGTTATRTANTLTSTCGSFARSPEHIYEFEVTSRTRLRFETVAPSSYDTVLHIRGAPCAGSATLFCDDDDGERTLSLLEETFEPGTYFLAVDGFGTGSRGDYTLEIENLGDRGQAVLIGHDYFASTPDQDRVVGNAVLLTSATGTIDILEYTEFSDNRPGGEAANTRGAIDRTVLAAGQTTRYTALTNFRNLATSLVGQDVLLVHEQEGAAFSAVTVRNSWRTELIDFLDDGGIVIVCSSLRDEWQILNIAGVFTITGDALVPSGPPALTIAAAGDPLLTGVTAYAPSAQTTSFAGSSGGTVVLRTLAGAPVVRRLQR